MVADAEKVCRQCGVLKPIGQFYRHAQMADGHLNKCKECVRARVTARRQECIEAHRAYDRARGKLPHRVAGRKDYAKRMKRDRPGYSARSSNEWRKKHPEVWKAHQVVASAIARGYLRRKPCEACGEQKTHAHHDDYSFPLEVRWLCAPCHGAVHAAQRETVRRGAAG